MLGLAGAVCNMIGGFIGSGLVMKMAVNSKTKHYIGTGIIGN